MGAALVLACVLGGFVIVKYRASRKVLGFATEYRSGGFRVTTVTPGGPADGILESADQLVALDGDTRVARFGMTYAVRTLAAGQPYDLTVRRHGVVRDVTLKVASVPRAAGDVTYLSTILLVALAFVVTGIVIGVLRPDEEITRTGAVALFLSSLTILRSAISATSAQLTGLETLLSPTLPSTTPLHLAVAFSFYAGFPTSVRQGPLVVWLRRALYAVGAVVMVATEIRARLLFQEGLPFVGLWAGLLPVVSAVNASLHDPYSIVAFASICLAIARSYRMVKEPDERRRMRWITFGSLSGISPWLVYLVVTSVTESDVPWLNRVANLALLIVPVTTGYAIVVHRLFDIRVVVRSGLRYLFARHVLTAALALPVAGLLVTIYRERNRTLSQILFDNTAYFYVFAVAAVSLVFRKRLRDALDRMFFRAAYDSEHILLELARQVPRLDSLSEISRLVSRELSTALHPKSFHVFHRGREKGSAPVLAFSFSSHERNATPSVDIPEDSALLRLLEGEQRAVDFPLRSHDELPEGEAEWLRQLGTTLIVPMNGGDGHLLGLLLLGEKLSEEPYGANDRRLLQALAAQMAVVHERSSQLERAEKDRRYAREVLSHLVNRDSYVKECPSCKYCQDGALSTCPNDGADLVVSLPVERTLEGRYKLMRLIGRGGMGAVYEAQDLRLGRQVAVKILMGSLFDNHIAVRRFEREAQTSARLNHPNIIAVHDFGTLQTGGAFLVMELLRGFTLRNELRTKGRLLPVAAVPLFGPILEGVKAAHAAGVIHRDLKPENVLIGRDTPAGGRPVVKILDFGLAKTTLVDFSKPDSLTLPGTVLGSLGYMAPEQFEGAGIDHRSDIFALGVLVAEVITGRAPFSGASFREVMQVTMRTEYHLPGDEPGIRKLDAVLQRCLAKSASERYASVAELQEVLLPALRDAPPLPYVAPSRDSDELPTHEMR